MKQYYAIKEIVTKSDSTFSADDTAHKLLLLLLEVDNNITGQEDLYGDSSSTIAVLPLYVAAAYLMMCGKLKEEDIVSEDLQADAVSLMKEALRHINPANAPIDIVTDGSDSVLEDYNMAIENGNISIDYLVV